MEDFCTLDKPKEVEFRPSQVEVGKPGIWCVKKIKEGTLFGPYCGEIVLHDKQNRLDYRYAWEVWNSDTDSLSYIINAGKKGIDHWLKYVNCARYFEEQNIVSVQIVNEIYYKAMKDIEIGEELLTWFNLSDRNSAQLDHITSIEENKMKTKKKSSSPKISPKKSPQKASSTQTSPSKTKIASSPSATKRRSPSNMDANTSNRKKQKFVQSKMNFKINKNSKNKSGKNVQSETAMNNVNSETSKQSPSTDSSKIFRFHTQKKHHYIQDGKKMYKCELCNVVYKRPFSLKRHFLRSHINCMYLCETDLTNCCIDLEHQRKQIENAQKLQSSGSRLLNGFIRSLTSSPTTQDAKLNQSDSKLYKKDLKDQGTDSSLPGLFKCNDCFFVFDDSKDLVAHFKCHDSKSGTKTPHRRQSTDKKFNSKQKKSMTLPYSLKESFDSLHISEASESTEGTMQSKTSRKILDKTLLKIVPSKRVSPQTSNKASPETKRSPVSPSKLGKTKSPNKDIPNVNGNLNKQEKFTSSRTPSKISHAFFVSKEVHSPSSKTKLDSARNVELVSVSASTAKRHSSKSPGQVDEYTKRTTPKKNTPSKAKSKSPATESARKSSLRSRSDSRSPLKRTNVGEDHSNLGTPKKSSLKSPLRRSNFSSPFSPKRLKRFGNNSPRRSPRSPVKRKARGSKYVKTEFKKFPCTKCKVKFSRQANLTKHLKEHTENKTCPCHICGKQFMSETKMKQHIRYHFSQNVRCRHCDLKFPNVGAMRQHLTEAHEDVWLINSKTTENTEETGNMKKKMVHRTHKDKIKVVSDFDFRSKEARTELPKPGLKSTTGTTSLSPPPNQSDFKVLSSPVPASKKKNVALDNSPAPNGYKSKLRYSCFTCKKRFISYYALVQHRRSNHRYSIFSAPSMSLHMKQKVSEEKNPVGNMPMLSPPVTPDPYYETVPDNNSRNWSTYMDGKSDSLKSYRKHIQIKGYKSIHSVAQYKPEALNWSNFNFPFHYEPYESVIGYSSYRPQPIVAEDLRSPAHFNNSITDSMHNKMNCTPLKVDISSEAAPILPCMASPVRPQTFQRRSSNDSDSKSMPSLSPTCQNTKFFNEVIDTNSIPKDSLDTCKDDENVCPSSPSILGTNDDVRPPSNSGNEADDQLIPTPNRDQSALNKTKVDIENHAFVPTLQYLKLVKTSERKTIETSLHAASASTPAQAFQKDFAAILKSQSWDGYYSDIEFGKLGDIVNVCSICFKYFDTEETLIRHQWTRHSSMSCRHLQMEKGHDIDNLFYPWPRNEGMVASSTPVPEDCHTLDSYKCSHCKSSFKNINRLHVHIIACDPKKRYYVEKLTVKERKKQEAKERKAEIKAIDAQSVGTSKKSATSGIKSKLDKRRKKEKMKKLIRIRERQTASSPSKHKEPVAPGKPQHGLSPRSLREVRRNEMDLLSNSDSRVTRQRKRKNYELLYVPMNHVRRRTSTKVVETHQCSGCSSKFRTLFLLERHARKCSEKEKLLLDASNEDRKDSKVNSPTQTCRFCKKKFTYIKSLANHYRNFCPVKKQQLMSNEEIEEVAVNNDESKSETVNDLLEEDANDHPEEPTNTKRRCGWPKGLKRKNRRKNHSWTITKRKKTSSDDSDVNPEKDKNTEVLEDDTDENTYTANHKDENQVNNDLIQDDVEQDSCMEQIDQITSNTILDETNTSEQNQSSKSNNEENTEDSPATAGNGVEFKESTQQSEETVTSIDKPSSQLNGITDATALVYSQSDDLSTKVDEGGHFVEVEQVSIDQKEISVSSQSMGSPETQVPDVCNQSDVGIKKDRDTCINTGPVANGMQSVLVLYRSPNTKCHSEVEDVKSTTSCESEPNQADSVDNGYHSDNNSNSKSANLEASVINGFSDSETNINPETNSYHSKDTPLSNGSFCENEHPRSNDPSSVDIHPPPLIEKPASYFTKQSVEPICLNSNQNPKMFLMENQKPNVDSTEAQCTRVKELKTDSVALCENDISTQESKQNPCEDTVKTNITFQNGDKNSETSSDSELDNSPDQNGLYNADTETDTDIVCYNGDTDSEDSFPSEMVKAEPNTSPDNESRKHQTSDKVDGLMA